MKHIWFWVGIAVISSQCSEKNTRFQLLDSEITGIEFVNSIEETDSFNILYNEYIYNGGGVGICDLNNDGLPDIILTGNKVTTQIYLNAGNFKFKNITHHFQGLSNEQWISGVTIVDINHDGWQDVYLTSSSGEDPLLRRNQLWVNQGTDKDGLPFFIEKAESYGIADKGYSVHAAFLDYDLDGDLDLYILNNTVNKFVPTNYRPKIVDGTSPNNDKFYENLGNGTFIDVTEKAGILVEGFGLGLAVSDINKDGYPDIYISNDYISNDFLLINRGDGTFQNKAKEYLSYQSKFSMGNDVCDVNNDGNPDIYTLDMLPRDHARKKQTIAGTSYFFYINDDKFGYEHQHVRNMLHLHNGFLNGELLPFSEAGQITGLFDSEWSWSSLFADFDNDGDRDLIVTNGFPKDLTDKDFAKYKAAMFQYLATDQQVLDRIPAVKVANFVFEKTGDLEYKDVTEEWGMHIPSYSSGAAFADLDNDGDLDYVVNNINDKVFIFRNSTEEESEGCTNYIKIELRGSGKNNMAIGSKVEIWRKDHYQFYEHFLTRGYISSVDPIIHFGLKDSIIDSIRVTWPLSDRQTVIKNVSANQRISLHENDAVLIEKKADRIRDELLFERVELIDYTHTQTDYVDFFQDQTILPHKFSQIGPCMAKGDLNGDGQEDLIISASDKLPTTVFLRERNEFIRTEFDGLTDRKKCLESDLAIFDVDGDGDNDIVAVSGGYANENPEDYRHFLYRREGNAFLKEELPLPPFPASVVRPFDFDHDGDMDLFIGARVKKGAFPFANESYILRNENGQFIRDPNSAFDLGMVTDAVWSDFDEDGWEDLIITREWNSITILQNQRGDNFVQKIDDNLESKRGVWSSIVAGDFDGDGDDDYLLGNLGNNHRFHVSDPYPMAIYAIDIDSNGTIAPLSTAFWKDPKGEMKEYLINGLDELASQAAFFRKRFTSYTQFSTTDIHEIIDTKSMPEKNKFFVNTTSSYYLRNDEGVLIWEKLPDKLQLSPIRKMVALDIDNDGNSDVIVAGNDYTYDATTGYYDANKGMILLGRGDHTFKILPPAESGMLIKGQVDGLLYFRGETPFLVAGVNRDKIAIFAHKKPSLPGLIF